MTWIAGCAVIVLVIAAADRVLGAQRRRYRRALEERLDELREDYEPVPRERAEALRRAAEPWR